MQIQFKLWFFLLETLSIFACNLSNLQNLWATKPKQNMFVRRAIKFSRFSLIYRNICRSTVRLNDEPPQSKEISGSVATKFQVFKNESGIIFDIEEERKRQDENNFYEEQQIFPSPYEGINLERKSIHLKYSLIVEFPKNFQLIAILSPIKNQFNLLFLHQAGSMEFLKSKIWSMFWNEKTPEISA